MKCLLTSFLLLALSIPSLILAQGIAAETGDQTVLHSAGQGILCHGPSFGIALADLPASHPLRQARNEEALILALSKELGWGSEIHFLRGEASDDALGWRHIRFQQLSHGFAVHGGGLVIHSRDGRPAKVNGRVYAGIAHGGEAEITGDQAVELAIRALGTDGAVAGSVDLVYAAADQGITGQTFRPCYRVPLTSNEALRQGIFFIDAGNGKLSHRLATSCHGDVPGIAHTLYSGVRPVTTDDFAGGFRLHQSGRPIQTRNLQHTTNLNFAIDITNPDNLWDEEIRVLRTLTLNQIQFPWWQSGGQSKPRIYLEFRDAANMLVARTPAVKDSFPPYTFPVQLPLRNPPYTVTFRDDDGNPLSDDFGGTFTVQANPGNPTFSAFGNSGNYQVVQENDPALDAHWCMEQVYDFFLEAFDRNSYDGAGGLVRSYVHFAFGWPNAAWGTLDNRMYLGDGNGVETGYRTYINVVAHEFAHGVIYHNGGGGLDYTAESGALNESFADIFGAATEFWSKPEMANWLHGEEGALIPGDYVRSMSDPHSREDPDTYGTNDSYWMDPLDSLDDGGIHTNSGVQNYWFYLLSEGGSGVNANGDAYTVEGIGIDKALRIAYRNLTTYLTASASSGFFDAWQGAIMAAGDLYGEGSGEQKAVRRAWYAVGLGDDPGLDPWCSGVDTLTAAQDVLGDGSGADTYANLTECGWLILPDTADAVRFSFSTFALADSQDVVTVYDGTEASAPVLAVYRGGDAPVPVTSTDGAMFLTFQSGASGVDAGWQADYEAQRVEYCGDMSLLDAPEGELEDGSAADRYGNHALCSWLIRPGNAQSITLDFSEVDLIPDGDRIEIFDGEDASAPLIASITGDQWSGPYVSSGGALFLRFQTGPLGRGQGWHAVYSSTPVSIHTPGHSLSSWEIFPNPVREKIFLRSRHGVHGPVSVFLYNTLGQQVDLWADLPLSPSGMEIHVGNHPAGMYVLQLRHGGQTELRVISIQ